MPNRNKHIRCARVLLGKSNPLVHQLMDLPSVKYGSIHRPITHNLEYLKDIEHLFGYEGKREAVIHMLQDWGVIIDKDWINKKKEKEE